MAEEGGAKRVRRVSYEDAEDEGRPSCVRRLHADSPGALLATPAPRAVSDLEYVARSRGRARRHLRARRRG